MPNNETKVLMPDRPRGQYDWVLAQQTIANLRTENDRLREEIRSGKTESSQAPE